MGDCCHELTCHIRCVFTFFIQAIAILAALLAFTSSNAFAVSAQITAAQLTRDADLVLIGRVKSRYTELADFVETAVDAEGNTVSANFKGFQTVYGIEILRELKGAHHGNHISVVISGGEIPGVGGLKHGKFVDLNEGEEVLTFLKFSTGLKNWRFLGGNQGVFRLEEVKSSNIDEQLAYPMYFDALVGDPAAPPSKAIGYDPIPLDDLIKEIRAQISSSKE